MTLIGRVKIAKVIFAIVVPLFWLGRVTIVILTGHRPVAYRDFKRNVLTGARIGMRRSALSIGIPVREVEAAEKELMR